MRTWGQGGWPGDNASGWPDGEGEGEGEGKGEGVVIIEIKD